MKKICILDYGMGNIKSLENSIKKIGFNVSFFSDKGNIDLNFLIVPGVGAFNSAIEIFKKKKIHLKIKEFLSYSNNNLLGICLGKQILFTHGFENKKTRGLNLINGDVNILSTNKNYKLPNVGWSEIYVKSNLGKFEFINNFNKQKFYFVHSFTGRPNIEENVLATSKYKDIEFCSISSNKKNIIGVQFHPEKSGKIGLEFLKLTLENLR